MRVKCRSLIHVTDWLPTVYEAAGGDVQDLGQIDGKSQWKALLALGPSPRSEMLYNIRPLFDFNNGPGAAIRLFPVS